MDRRVVWTVRNGALALALYFALVEHVGWLTYVIGGFAWWMLATAAWAVSDPAPSRRSTSADAPPSSAMVFDLAVLASMFVAHWYWTAFAFALSRGCSAMVHARATSKP
jgi:hypothetical protein